MKFEEKSSLNESSSVVTTKPSNKYDGSSGEATTDKYTSIVSSNSSNGANDVNSNNGPSGEASGASTTEEYTSIASCNSSNGTNKKMHQIL